MAREANLDARAISEEDTLLFFKRIVAKLHGVNLNKEFSSLKKKQENTVKLLPVEKPHRVKVVKNPKVRPLRYQKEIRVKEKEKGAIELRLHLHLLIRKVANRRKEIPRVSQPLLKERPLNQCLSRTHLRERRRRLRPEQLVHPKQRQR